MDNYFPENKRVRPRIVKDEFYDKEAPNNAIWWAVKGNC
jgi:hypothetical protein